MELSLPKGGEKIQATRYYTFAGRTVAIRTDKGDLSFLASDHHGTGELAVDAETGAVSQRRFDPYGVERGKAAGEWPGEKGFVGATIDAQTGLTHMGAREYDPGLGKFISVDPVIDFFSPQQMNGYGYANNSPVTLSDPSGLLPCATGIQLSCGPCNPIFSSCGGGGGGGHGGGGGGGGGGHQDWVVHQAQHQVYSAQRNLGTAKHRVVQAAKSLVKIARDILGVDAAMDCVSTGDLGSCGETLLNVAGSFAGGLAGKILSKYGMPWNWAKGARLTKRVWGLLGDLVGGAKDMWKASKSLDKAKDSLAAARAKAKSMVSKGKEPAKCHSFLPGTKVLLSDGSTKAIEDVGLGDKVTVTDPETGETTTREVVGTIVTKDDKHFVDLTISTEKAPADGTAEDGKGGKAGDDGKAGEPVEAAKKTAALISTTTHPFWVTSEKRWIKAGDLEPGMTLRTPKGDRVTVEGVRHFEERRRTHDLTISGIHTYHVLAGAAPVLAHNCGGSQPGHSDLCRCDPENPRSEVVLDTDSFEQARNQALNTVGPIDTGSWKRRQGTMESAVDTFGRDTGFTATSGGEYRSFRLDTDDRIGPHINVMTGKGAAVRKWAIRFPGGGISTWLRRNV
ncbi:RHS repeat-associated core domain-containing protein [Streptomyces sp. bgisy100]|uniref:RHS repeat-associated core domain-containing protein n=1 Tax=Streptomyces sp. bgisy100 TaxID=3413783 RepID=UPI003D735F60